MELDQLESSLAVRSLHHRNVIPDAFEPDDAVYPPAFDGHRALQLESELGEELGRRREVVDDDADVLHPLDGHGLDGTSAEWRGRLARAGVLVVAGAARREVSRASTPSSSPRARSMGLPL